MSSDQPASLETANIQWDDNGQPLSSEFDDVYFSRTNGIEETRYVFLNQNNLPERWKALSGQDFTIAETGFGTGLNFLCAAKFWLYTCENGTLHYISAEKFPLTKSDLERALKLWPELNSLAEELLDQYPPAVPGIHRLKLAKGRIILTLLYGDAAKMFASLKGSDHPQFSRSGSPNIDAWFLDGFAPAKNPAMWTEKLFQTVADLSNTGTTFSTFTAAGAVRIGLKTVGFEVEKADGYGHKRDMLRGVMQAKPEPVYSDKDWQPSSFNSPHQPPWDLSNPIERLETAPKSAIVIGGGIAGCSTARALAERNITVTLIERHSQLAQEGSGNPQGILYPKLSNKSSPLSRFGLAALLNASRYHRAWLNQTGVLVLPESEEDQSTFTEINALYPDELVQLLTGNQISEVSGIELNNKCGLYFPKLGWINPPQVCGSLVSHLNITVIQGEVNDIQRNQHWHALSQNGSILAEADIAVIASGFASKQFSQTEHLPLKQIRGQISALPANETSEQLKTVICGEGYIAPATGGIHTLGATYNIGESSLELRKQDHRTNLQQLAKTDSTLGEIFSATNTENLDGRAAFRCTTPDYLPIAGPAPVQESYLEDYALLRKNARAHIPVEGKHWLGLYLNCGHGSRGMSYAPLCAELIASQICGEASPLELDLRKALHPGRFLIRKIKRSNPV